MWGLLTNCIQRVVYDQEKPVLLGVPQGTVLGPLVFLLYINDLSSQLESDTRLFAEDCFVNTSGDEEEYKRVPQSDLNKFETWQDRWNMSFNPSKWSAIQIPYRRNKQFVLSSNSVVKGYNKLIPILILVWRSTRRWLTWLDLLLSNFVTRSSFEDHSDATLHGWYFSSTSYWASMCWDLSWQHHSI